ncbi:hypothetical protein NMG60_11030823 [Bertholletia excelsa]
MENEEMKDKNMKLEIPPEAEMTSPTSSPAVASALTRQGSIAKNICLCSPTTHAGSFRCRLHRPAPSIPRTKSTDLASALKDLQSKADATTEETTSVSGEAADGAK